MPRDDAIIFSDLIGARRWAGHSYPREFSVFFIHSVARAARRSYLDAISSLAALSSGSLDRCANCCACCACKRQ